MYTVVQLLSILFMLSPFTSGRVDDLHTRIVRAAESMLSSQYTESIEKLEIRVVRTGGTIQETGSIKLVWPQKPEVPRALLRVSIHSKDIHANTYSGWALLYIAHYDSVFVINRSVKKDEQILSSELSTIWKETTRFHGTPLTPKLFRQLSVTGDIFANRYIAEDRVLKESDLRNAYDVETGQQVIMTYERHGIAFELSCKSRNKGYKGDIIKLFSPDTQHMYKARISGLRTATWVETLE